MGGGGHATLSEVWRRQARTGRKAREGSKVHTEIKKKGEISMFIGTHAWDYARSKRMSIVL